MPDTQEHDDESHVVAHVLDELGNVRRDVATLYTEFQSFAAEQRERAKIDTRLNHDQRIANLEKWRWALPASLVVVVLSSVLA